MLQEYPLGVIEQLARERRTLMRSRGEKFANEAINSFAKFLADATKGMVASNLISAVTEVPPHIEKPAFELAVVLYAYATEFSGLTSGVLEGATLECVYEEAHGTSAFHVSIPGNIFDTKLLSPSINIDMFLTTQRKLLSATEVIVG
jgi:hypothetical protein